jgi:hypothetical protein
MLSQSWFFNRFRDNGTGRGCDKSHSKIFEPLIIWLFRLGYFFAKKQRSSKRALGRVTDGLGRHHPVDDGDPRFARRV